MKQPCEHGRYERHMEVTVGEYCEEGCNDVDCNLVYTRCDGGRLVEATSDNYSLTEWIECTMSALDAATTIGRRSCQPGDHLHYANHHKLFVAGNELLATLGAIDEIGERSNG